MTDAEKKSYKDGYQRAVKEIMDDLAEIHSKHPNQIELRKIVDFVWASVKVRLEKSRGKGFIRDN